jgi:hypothetical protein
MEKERGETKSRRAEGERCRADETEGNRQRGITDEKLNGERQKGETERTR